MEKLKIYENEIEKYILGTQEINHGANGTIHRLSSDTLMKLYYSILQNKECNDLKTIRDNIVKFATEENFLKKIYPDYHSFTDRMEMIYTRLQETKSDDLVLGGIYFDWYFKNYIIGVLLHDYTKDGYIPYKKIVLSLDKTQNEKVWDNAMDKIIDLFNHHIYPTDISCGNLMVRPSDLSVKLLDLDDLSTKYANSYNELYYDKTRKKVEQVKNRVLKIQ